MFLRSRARIPAPHFTPSRQRHTPLPPLDTSFWTSRFVEWTTRPLAGGEDYARSAYPTQDQNPVMKAKPECPLDSTHIALSTPSYCGLGKRGFQSADGPLFGREVPTNLHAEAVIVRYSD